MYTRLLLLQCSSLLILFVTGLPVDETAKNTGDTVEITPTEDKLPKTGDITDLDDLEKIVPDTLPDQLPEYGETAKKPGDTVETVEITPTEDKLPKTGTSEDNAPKTGQSLGDLDQLIPELIPDLPDLPKVPDLIPGCKKENQSCSGLPTCCGDLQCYWEKGLSFVKEGVCVPCVADGLSCYRSGQCCGNNNDDDTDPDAVICDKGTNPFEDGTCSTKRTSGKCYKNKQCKGHKCDKKWYRLTGNCVTEVQ